MTKRTSRLSRPEQLALAAADYQAASVIPHCPSCTQPCCKLDALVLELNWKQVKVFWQLRESRAAFDQRLATGTGPEEIRAMDGHYFAHRKPCPAYDLTQRNCRVYGQELKPVGCTDFPVYENQGSVIADLRCEAVDLAVLVRRLASAVGPGFRIVQSPDADFPFLVTLSAKRETDATPGSHGSDRPRFHPRSRKQRNGAA